MKIFCSLFAVLALSILACVPPDESFKHEVNVDFSDPQVQKIISFEHERKVDSLLLNFSSENASIRYLAVRAFRSIQSDKAIEELSLKLKDPIQSIREAAAYSLGQQKSLKAEYKLQESFHQSDTLGEESLFNSLILEAIGKCGGEQNLENLASISTYFDTDTLLILGQAKGIFEYLVRGQTAESGTLKMLEFATNNSLPEKVRLYGAVYLARAQYGNLPNESRVKLINSFSEVKNPKIRMFLALAVGKLKTAEAQNVLIEKFDEIGDYRVKCNIIRALSNFEYAKVQKIPFQAIRSSNKHVKHVAVQYFINNGSAQDGALYYRMSREPENEDIKVDLLAAAARHLPAYFKETHYLINRDLQRIFTDETTDILVKAKAIEAMGGNIWNYRKIWELASSDTLPPVIHTSLMRAYQNIFDRPAIDKSYSTRWNSVFKEVSGYLSTAINNFDIGGVSIAANILSSKELNWASQYENSSFLHVKQRNTKLPKEVESNYSLNEAINRFDSKEKKNITLTEMSKINWEKLTSLGENPLATISTIHGNIIVELKPHLAPGTVSYFAELVAKKVYDDKYFARVVPNFVVQGGCENGDSYGSYSEFTTSEFSDIGYLEEGWIGMASVGRDTETMQFFITHSPTIHLIGNYTSFGKVVEGMDIVHKIMQGDKIQKISISATPKKVGGETI